MEGLAFASDRVRSYPYRRRCRRWSFTMSSRLIRTLGASILALVLGGYACSAETNPPHDQRLTISFRGRTYGLAARVYRPSGSGAFPLIVFNHGLPAGLSDASSVRLGF